MISRPGGGPGQRSSELLNAELIIINCPNSPVESFDIVSQSQGGAEKIDQLLRRIDETYICESEGVEAHLPRTKRIVPKWVDGPNGVKVLNHFRRQPRFNIPPQ